MRRDQRHQSLATQGRLPREVWIATFQGGAPGATPLEKAHGFVRRMEEAAVFQPDIVCLPEAGPYEGLPGGRPPIAEIAETPPGPLCEVFARFASDHRCYVFCPLYTREGGRFYNALVLLDRDGKVVGEYRKMHPTVGEMEDGIHPGPDAPVFHTDFGVVGAQICFDIGWDDGWELLRRRGAEVVFWSSAYGGGRALNARAQVGKCCVVSSTWKGVTRIIDMTGDEMAWTGRWKEWLCAPVNLERAFLHTWPYYTRFADIEAKYGPAIRITTHHEEEWSIVESRSHDVWVADVLREFAIPTYREMIAEAERMQRTVRGEPGVVSSRRAAEER